MRESHELKRVGSPRVSVLQKDQVCDFCKKDLYAGERVHNYGVIDRFHRQCTRIYFCEDHGHILGNLNNEDLPEYHQEYLIDNGFTNEMFYK